MGHIIEDYSFGKADVKFKQLGDKLVKDGKTAILTNSKWGLDIDLFRYDPMIIKLVLDKKKFKRSDCKDCTFSDRNKYNDDVDIFNNNINKQIIDYCTTKYNLTVFSHETFWPDCLTVHWIPVNTFFTIAHCGDNGESIITIQDCIWNRA